MLICLTILMILCVIKIIIDYNNAENNFIKIAYSNFKVINNMEKEVFEKMITEFNEVNERCIKLREFILSDNAKKLDNLNHDLLIAQLKSMESYASILSIRIGLNAPVDNSENTESSEVSE